MQRLQADGLHTGGAQRPLAAAMHRQAGRQQVHAMQVPVRGTLHLDDNTVNKLRSHKQPLYAAGITKVNWGGGEMNFLNFG